MKANTRLPLAVALSMCLGFIAIPASQPLFAQIERQHEAHVHGEATGTLAQDEETFELELEIPGVNLVGFERPPRNNDEVREIENALQWLRTGEHWLATDPRGGCRIDRVRAHTHGFDRDGDGHAAHEPAGEDSDHHHADGHHDKGHGHDDGYRHEAHDHEDHHHVEHGHADHDHAEFHIVAHVECDHPDRLGWMRLNLFEEFPGNERLRVDYFTSHGQGQVRLAPGNTTIHF